ncbi:histidine kinase dimerization/phosphoacceptor domain -containing protein [Chryseolinea lacunae]|uniref:histidine kinase n=1 Tax=Chryseolinea lacunae TaxID=2801331 RepID=A0ABS1KK93_9BACT|nr:histidine kinase dimerization/phosphoacceptor domain -containing protein [Chryseolinea lacunae]MBL0739871.1 tetratricopeptide repeat protein [Chryseolinea lacunae]
MPRVCLIVFFLFGMLLAVCGQNKESKADAEMVEKLRRSKPDTGRVRLLNQIGEVHLNVSRRSEKDLQRAVYYLRKAVQLSDSLPAHAGWRKLDSHCLLGEALIASKQIDEAEGVFNSITKAQHALGDVEGEAETWFRKANALMNVELEWEETDSSYARAARLYHSVCNFSDEIEVRLEMADAHSRWGHNALAEREFLSLINLSRQHECVHLSHACYLLSALHRYMGNFNKGLTYAMEALKVMHDTGDTTGAATCYGELGLQYQELNRPAESEFYYKKCLAVREKMHVQQFIIYRTASLLVTELIKQKKTREALRLLEGLKERNPPNGPSEAATMAQSLAYCYADLGDYALAEKNFMAMVRGYREGEWNSEVILIGDYDVGKFYVDRKQFTKAEPFLQHALKEAFTTSMSRRKDIHYMLFKTDSAGGRFAHALHHFQQYKLLNDTIFDEVKSRQIEELHIQYQTEQKDADIRLKDDNIALLTRQSQLQDATLLQARVIRNLTLGALALLALVLGLVYNQNRIKQRANLRLERQQEEINQTNFSLQLLVNEKDWLVREIHHRVKNNFHMVMGLLGTQAAYLQSEEALRALVDSQHRIHTMSLIHQKLYQTENLSAIAMTDYIHELVEYLKDSFDTRHIRFVVSSERLDLDFSHSLPIGLILNEAITNAIKFAFPGQREGTINLSLRHLSIHELCLTIADDGVGLPPGFETQKVSMGINLMRGLTEDISGVFSMESHLGTTIRVTFPYQETASKIATVTGAKATSVSH